jgi:3D (Asp-Asp-Asp) domain-containing protein
VSSTCYAQAGQTASGQSTRSGIVANNFLPLGTRILLDRPAFGRRVYIVLDRIGWGSQLDIFNPSEAACVQYGRRTVGFRVL